MPEINLLILDFDGVLTDNKVYVFEDGREAVVCHRGDGWGIRMLQSAGIEVIILSTETNAVVSARAEKLNVACIQGCEDKASAVQSIIDAMKLVGHRVAPADAHPQIRAIATMVTDSSGGQGVVRELADLLVTKCASTLQ